jgi:hypothetical protein
MTPPPHAYNNPNLSPAQFLLAVMNASHLPLSIRIDAALGAAHVQRWDVIPVEARPDPDPHTIADVARRLVQ